MYTELTCMRILYRDITCVYGKTHMTIVQVILTLEITELSYIMLYFGLVTYYFGKGNKWADIGYNINYMKVFE